MVTPSLPSFSSPVATYRKSITPKSNQITFQADHLRQRRPSRLLVFLDPSSDPSPTYEPHTRNPLIPDEVITATNAHQNRTFRNGTANAMVYVLNNTSIPLEMNIAVPPNNSPIMQTMVYNPNLTAEVLTSAIIKRGGKITKTQLKNTLEEGRYKYAKRPLKIKEALNNNSRLPANSTAQDIEMTAIYLVLDGLDKKPSILSQLQKFQFQKSNAELLKNLATPLAATHQDPEVTLRNLGPLLSKLVSHKSEERILLDFLQSLVPTLNNG